MHEQLLARLGAPARQADLLVSAAVSARKTGARRAGHGGWLALLGWGSQGRSACAPCDLEGNKKKKNESTTQVLATPPRTTDHYAQATTSLYRLRALLQRQAGGAGAGWAQALAAPDACWRVEEAKLLWAQGQRDTAVQLARSLLGAGAARQGGGGGGGGGGALQHAYLRSLTAKWLSRTRSDSPSSVLSLMQASVGAMAGGGRAGEREVLEWAEASGLGFTRRGSDPTSPAHDPCTRLLPLLGPAQEAADEAQGALGEVGGGAAGALGERARACRVLYRLAAYADGLYRNIEVSRGAAVGLVRVHACAVAAGRVGGEPRPWPPGAPLAPPWHPAGLTTRAPLAPSVRRPTHRPRRRPPSTTPPSRSSAPSGGRWAGQQTCAAAASATAASFPGWAGAVAWAASQPAIADPPTAAPGRLSSRSPRHRPAAGGVGGAAGGAAAARRGAGGPQGPAGRPRVAPAGLPHQRHAQAGGDGRGGAAGG